MITHYKLGSVSPLPTLAQFFCTQFPVTLRGSIQRKRYSPIIWLLFFQECLFQCNQRCTLVEKSFFFSLGKGNRAHSSSAVESIREKWSAGLAAMAKQGFLLCNPQTETLFLLGKYLDAVYSSNSLWETSNPDIRGQVIWYAVPLKRKLQKIGCFEQSIMKIWRTSATFKNSQSENQMERKLKRLQRKNLKHIPMVIYRVVFFLGRNTYKIGFTSYFRRNVM